MSNLLSTRENSEVLQPMVGKSGVRAQRREKTESSMLDAFEKVLVRDGIRHLTVKAVVEEAGVSKPLLYRYFDGLPGLVRVWSERRRFWPEAEPPGGMASRYVEGESEFKQAIAEEMIALGHYLRSHPVTLEFLAEELNAKSEISDAFAQTRDDYGRPFLQTLVKDPRYADPGNRPLIVVLGAALIYLAMRSRRSPDFMGLRLDTEQGWNEAMDMVRRLSV